jgi:hypothetical protein
MNQANRPLRRERDPEPGGVRIEIDEFFVVIPCGPDER